MRSYTNREGDVIVVSQEHLDTAVRIKRELQMASPSHRTNWTQHVALMQSEGFGDSEVSENYRQMIKTYQASTGTIETRGKQADLIADSKLNSIKEAVGDMYYAKREVQMENMKLSRLKREVSLYGVVAEQVRDALLNELNEEIPVFIHTDELRVSGSQMVVLLSDWHIGATVDGVKGNTFDYEVARRRVAKYLERVRQIAMDEYVTEIHVVCMGDMTEHVSMRKVNQAHEAEFPMAVQIVKAYELIRNFIFGLSIDFAVTYSGISGNHDRMNGEKNDNIDGDSTIYVINFMLKEFIEKVRSSHLSYIESDHMNYSTTLSVNGQHMKFVHGDNEKGNKKLAAHSDMDNTSYNVLAMGHLHHHSVKEVGQDKFEIYVGSLMGANNYGVKGKFLSNASQGVIVVNPLGEIDIKRVDLQQA